MSTKSYGKNVTLESDIGSLTAAMLPKAEQIVERTAVMVQRGAMIRSRVDTGQMRAGWEKRWR